MQIKNLGNYFNNITISLVMLVIYMFLVLIFFPNGINTVFVSLALKYTLVLIAFSFLLFILMIFLTKDKPLFYLTRDKNLFNLKKIEHFEFKDLILILLPMTPITQYIIFNNEILFIEDLMIIILFFISLIFIFVNVIPWLLSILASRQILMMAALSFLFIILNMPSFSANFNWHQQGSFNIQLIILVSTSIILLMVNFISKKILIGAIMTFFTINTITALLGPDILYSLPQNNDGSQQEIKKAPIESAIKGREIKNKNDIFFIVYESYSNYETMKHYGFDNSVHLEFLEQNGFHIYHGVYSLGTPSIPSLSRVFNVERVIPHEKSIYGGEAVFKILNKKGYKTHGIFQNDQHFRGLSLEEIKYDFFFPPPSSGANLLIKAILGGEFSDEVSLEGVGFDAYLRQKRRLISQKDPSSVFMYAHSPAPGHRPFSTQSPDDVDKYTSIHLNHIEIANIDMQQDVSLLMKYNPNAISIIAGDHGPFLTKTGVGLLSNPDKYSVNDINRYDMQDRYGAFLAIRWPDENYATKHDIKILQDIFPAVFAYLFDDYKLFDDTRIQSRTTVSPQNICGVSIEDGIIVGGKDDGKPLFKGVE